MEQVDNKNWSGNTKEWKEQNIVARFVLLTTAQRRYFTVFETRSKTFFFTVGTSHKGRSRIGAGPYKTIQAATYMALERFLLTHTRDIDEAASLHIEISNDYSIPHTKTLMFVPFLDLTGSIVFFSKDLDNSFGTIDKIETGESHLIDATCILVQELFAFGNIINSITVK